ncbi:hypothetical protein K461DRAFT_121101 [Myriangium duriaei CBS 260.36]|uniref:Uncharacterized protein n=1 Tax=Myriangium duriaei CBS 260.36 TaxID=1168546 RepID=A0A9P4MLB5_9PEZI|nr:hypothetical protein K461DRAFT_121101 [Myriangium duriaei CBS 260.36]
MLGEFLHPLYVLLYIIVSLSSGTFLIDQGSVVSLFTKRYVNKDRDIYRAYPRCETLRSSWTDCRIQRPIEQM